MRVDNEVTALIEARKLPYAMGRAVECLFAAAEVDGPDRHDALDLAQRYIGATPVAGSGKRAAYEVRRPRPQNGKVQGGNDVGKGEAASDRQKKSGQERKPRQIHRVCEVCGKEKHVGAFRGSGSTTCARR